MAIATRAGLESLTDWLNIPGSDGTGIGGAIGSLAMLAKIWYEMTKGKTDRPPLPNVSTDKVLPKDLANQMAWPEAGKMVQELLNNANTNIGTLIDTYSKWLRKDMVWPNEGQMVETLPLGDTGKLDITTPATPPRFNENLAWPEAGKMVETLPLGDTGKLDVPAPVIPGSTTIPNNIPWPNEGQMVETLPLGDTGKLDVPAPVIPGSTTIPNNIPWPNAGQMVETLPLGDTGKLDVTAPIIDVRPNTGTTDITDVGTNTGTNEWVSGGINATETWPNEGEMVESIPPYYNDGPNIDWSGPMITDKTNENNEVTINPVTFDSFYDLIRAEQKARWDREDAIRKETQEREDSALQRWVADARKAGINPNLAMGLKGAESGGGITQATGMNYAMWESGLQKEIALLQQSIDQNFKGDENDKDRFVQLLGNVLSMFSVIAMFKGKI